MCSVVSDSLGPHRLQSTSLPVYGILQARVLEWVAVSSSNKNGQKQLITINENNSGISNNVDKLAYVLHTVISTVHRSFYSHTSMK